MAADVVFSQVGHTRRVGISVSDALLVAMRTHGAFPPPQGRLECVIVQQTAPVARAFEPPRVLATVRHAGGFLSTDGAWVGDRSGSHRPLGTGTYQAEIRGDFYRPLGFQLNWPLPPGETRVRINGLGTAELMPSPSYPLPDVTTSRFQLGPTIIRGCLVGEDGTPQEDVAVEATGLPLLNPPELPQLAAWPFFATRTDSKGDWAVVLPGRRYIDATPELLPPNTVLQKNVTILLHPATGDVNVNVPVVLASEHSLRNTALRGQILGAGGRPITGAVITTSLDARRSRSRADGAWSLYFDLNQADAAGVNVTATLPDGRTQTTPGVAVQKRATVVVPTIQFS